MGIDATTKNSLGYQGCVRITYNNRGHKHSVYVHNEGTEYLGNIITIALSGDTKNITELPRLIPSSLGFEVIKNNGDVRNLLSSRVPLTSGVWGTSVADTNTPLNVIGKTQYNAIISSDSLIKGYSSNDRFRLKLMNKKNQILAYISDSSDTSNSSRPLALLYQALDGGQDAMIDWIMYISNITE